MLQPLKFQSFIVKNQSGFEFSAAVHEEKNSVRMSRYFAKSKQSTMRN
jgi:hypothetical protein